MKKIEWNKVTWYSKLAAVILFVLVFLLAFHLGERYGEIKSGYSSYGWGHDRGMNFRNHMPMNQNW